MAFPSFLPLPALVLVLSSLVVNVCGQTSVVLAVPPLPSTAHRVSSNFLGISFELSYINVYFGNDEASIPFPIYNYLGAISARTGTQSVRARLGGNSMDDSTYVPSQQQMLVFTDPTANVNDIPVNFGPLLWDVMAKVANVLGGMKYVVGLSLLDPTDTRAANIPLMAGSAQQTLGSYLDVFLLGNEPDLYSVHDKRPNLQNYTVQDYISEFGTASDGLKNTSGGDITALAEIGGPTVCCVWDLATLIQQGWLDTYSSEIKYISLQHYPNNNCNLGPIKYTIADYMDHTQVVNLTQWNSAGVTLAAQKGKSTIMSEFNSVSCGGLPGLSNTFAVGALWTLDYALQLAASGYSAAYLHTREPGVSYNMFDAPPAGSGGSWTTNPTWYSLLASADILGGTDSGTYIIDLNADGGMFDESAADHAAYAAYDAATSALNRIALFNYATSGSRRFTIPSSAIASSVSLGLANVDATNITVLFLTAASTTEQFDITYGGITYQGQKDGSATSASSTRPQRATIDCTSDCFVDVPGPGLAIVMINPAAPASTAASSSSSSSLRPAATGKGSNDQASGARSLSFSHSAWTFVAFLIAICLS